MKVLKFDHNSVLAGLELEEADGVRDADAVLVWTDTTLIERSIIDHARRNNLKTAVYQHGRKGSSRYHAPFKERLYADKIFVWGEFDRQRMIASGHSPHRIHVVGSTIFKHLKPRLPHEGVNVVFCPEHWDRPVDENIKVRDELRKLKGVKITTKIIESHNPEDFDNPVQTDRDDKSHLPKCVEVLQTADVVVGVSESTFELLAQAMDIPVVIMQEWEPKAFGGDMRYTEYPRLLSTASACANIDNLCDTVVNELKNPDRLKEERQRVVVAEGGFGLNPAEEIKKVWEN